MGGIEEKKEEGKGEGQKLPLQKRDGQREWGVVPLMLFLGVFVIIFVFRFLKQDLKLWSHRDQQDGL